jgi:periplasmic protein TonB
MTESPSREEHANFLGGWLVESDSEFEKRARRIKRRALVASIVLQVLIVAALVLFPLLSKGESIAGYTYTPVPPYRHGSVSDHHQHESRPSGHRRTICITCFHSVQPIVTTSGPVPASEPIDDNGDAPPGSLEGPNIPGLPNNSLGRREPPPPPSETAKPRTVQVASKVQEARLVRRIEPVYPYLAKVTHREGRVELRALIATDGRIRSLEVVSGDPLLIQSALSAVGEWRYQPTLLNGEPVEVETYITVIYTLNH